MTDTTELQAQLDKATAAFLRSEENATQLSAFLELSAEYKFDRVTVRRVRRSLNVEWEVVYPPQCEWMWGLDMTQGANWSDDPEAHSHANPIVESYSWVVTALKRAEQIQAQINAYA